MSKWGFDRIYCIHCAEREDRYHHMIKQFTKVGLENDFEWWWVCYNPWGKFINYGLNLSKHGTNLRKPNEYSNGREQYACIKQAYLRGMDKILIFEDDNFFLNDKDMFNEFMENIPKNFDIIRLGGMCKDEHLELRDEYDKGKYWVPLTFGLWGGNGYALSRLGMEYYMKYMEDHLEPADNPLFFNTNSQIMSGPMNVNYGIEINHYISTIPLLYENQEIESSLRSTDDWDDDVFNFYKNIDKSKYYDCQIQ